jgi:hypothetical protein
LALIEEKKEKLDKFVMINNDKHTNKTFKRKIDLTKTRSTDPQLSK